MGMQQTSLQLADLTTEVHTQDVVSEPIQVLTLSEKVALAIKAIKAQVLAGRHLSCAFSGGKDSSVTLAITLMAMRELIDEGVTVPTLNVCHSDTKIESPVVKAYNTLMIQQIEAYSKASGIPVRVWIASPGLSNDYLVNVIGGRTIMSVGSNAKCSMMMKVEPLNKLKRQLRKTIAAETGKKAKEVEIVTLIGTRFEESAARKRAMTERGESAVDAVDAMDDGQLVLSPIAEFSTMEVFEFIGNVRAKRLETYDSFDSLVEIYRDANQGDCMVTAYIANREQARTPCSARTGCWGCLRISSDTSANSFLNHEDGKYEWLRPLVELREFMKRMHFNPKARAWVARDVSEDGYIQIIPNAYSPSYTKALLQAILSIQAREEDEARKLGIAPRFELLTLKQVMAIELNWGRYGYQKPWTAMRIWNDVYRHGKRYKLPDAESIPVYTEKDVSFRARIPFADAQYNSPYSGLRNIDAEMANAEDLMVARDGRLLTRCETGDEYDIDDEGLELFMEFELDRVLNAERLNDAPSAAVHYLLGLGTVQLYKGSQSDWDRMLRVSNQLHRHNLLEVLHDPQAIIARVAEKLTAHGKSPSLITTNQPVLIDLTPDQGSLFEAQSAASEPAAVPPTDPALALKEREVQDENQEDTSYEAQYKAAVRQMEQELDDECPIPSFSKMLSECCVMLSKLPLTQYSFDAFMALWVAESGYGADGDTPPASAYEPIVKVAYSVLLSGGLILAP
ncbi:phosphoadenosine phosphosulfate reductase family protein [Pseudomonas aeruginosa]|nr:phosphoadenosine phosphosulfate reductase family protein [Pseudomonas aeruginosa]HCF2991469.1 phosphoadenosine phosphosulfate reductase family protein [Pseudomonas aeruginosa]